jgi:hypothetical protein
LIGQKKIIHTSLEKNKNSFFFEKINSKWLTKKAHFPAPPILNIFSQKFDPLVLWLVGLIDAKCIGVAQPIWS